MKAKGLGGSCCATAAFDVRTTADRAASITRFGGEARPAPAVTPALEGAKTLLIGLRGRRECSRHDSFFFLAALRHVSTVTSHQSVPQYKEHFER